jgi:hypothetical protein
MERLMTLLVVALIFVLLAIVDESGVVIRSKELWIGKAACLVIAAYQIDKIFYGEDDSDADS